MDIYTIARIFKKIEDKKQNGVTIVVDKPNTNRNIIIYAGDDHSIMYRSFLEFLGFKLIFYRETTDRTFIRCLQLTKNNLTIETPLFNKINNQKIFIGFNYF